MLFTPMPLSPHNARFGMCRARSMISIHCTIMYIMMSAVKTLAAMRLPVHQGSD